MSSKVPLGVQVLILLDNSWSQCNTCVSELSHPTNERAFVSYYLFLICWRLLPGGTDSLECSAYLTCRQSWQKWPENTFKHRAVYEGSWRRAWFKQHRCWAAQCLLFCTMHPLSSIFNLAHLVIDTSMMYGLLHLRERETEMETETENIVSAAALVAREPTAIRHSLLYQTF